MNPVLYSAEARTTTRVVTETPDDCEHCGMLNTPAVAAVYWDSATSTTFGYTEPCGPCLPQVVDDALADSRGGTRVTVEQFVTEQTDDLHGRILVAAA